MTTLVIGEEAQIDGAVVAVKVLLNQGKELEARTLLVGNSLYDTVTVLDSNERALWHRGSHSVRLEVGEPDQQPVVVYVDDGAIQGNQVLFVYGPVTNLTVTLTK